MQPTPHDFGIDPDERSEVLESLLEAIGVPFLVVDKDLRLLFFSARAASLFGLRLSDVGKPLESIVPSGSSVEAVASVSKAINRRETLSTRLIGEDGYEYKQRSQPLETPHEEVTGAVMTYSRHSEVDRDLRGMDELVQLYVALFSHSPDPVIRIDSSERLLYVNRAAASIIHLTPEELEGRQAGLLTRTGAMSETWLASVQRALSLGGAEKLVLTANQAGRRRELLWRFLPEFNEFGVPDGVVCTATDVTDLMAEKGRLEEEVESRDEALQEAHHRIREQLLILSDLIDREVDRLNAYPADSESRFAALEASVKQAASRTRRIATLHERLLKARSPETRRVAVRPFLQEILATFSQLKEASNLEFEAHIEEISLSDRLTAALGEIVTDLVSSAIEGTTESEPSNRIGLELQRSDNDHLELTVWNDRWEQEQNEAVDTPRTASSGVRLATHVTERLDGELILGGEQGTIATVTLPLSTI
ncbi:MAG: PAS domain-containing protein [Alkalispirochaetaceae bacterium]